MRGYFLMVSAVLVLSLSFDRSLGADEAGDAVKAQKEAAPKIWKRMFGDDILNQHETAHFLLNAPVGINDKQLKALGVALEAQLPLARKAIQLEAKDEIWTGKLSVWIFDQRNHFTSFVRTVEKKRPMADDLGSYSVSGDFPHIAAGPGPQKWHPSEELQIGIQLGAAVLSKKGGNDLPEWMVSGFGRATAWRAAPAVFSGERLKVKALTKSYTAKDAWGDDVAKPEDAVLLRASVMDYLAYGPYAKGFPMFLENLKPEEDENTNEKKAKPIGDALKVIKLNPDRLNQGWYSWVTTGR